ncbi:MAG: class I SAM-dependent methyltransferase [Leptolyngbyaceae cyanobacterium RM2_2_4]|nr:class I SAM-dependent methyltransferase [Leptolyngbyaceae cyanobacterium SM1_4_3]NJN56668.1 class I SAM-dependent methyltransferase [Leptolyngbyaceae cyanobacterium SL_5_9]NJO51189.1 class I SAM-dependent methyltransferase [Leptolyngbyaceae cyanobacterium RM2_2_4]
MNGLDFSAPKSLDKLTRYIGFWQVALHLYRENHPTSNSVANAITDILINRNTLQEKAWIRRIESLRTELIQSNEKLINYSSSYQERIEWIRDICQRNSKNSTWSLLLFKLIRELQPHTCIELGTCLGISTAYQAAALQVNNHGKIITLEGAESYAAIAKRNFEQLDLQVSVVIGLFQDTLQEVLQQQNKIDFAFIDGHHDERATISYYKQLLPFLSNNAVIVFDDIAWSEGMKRAWHYLCNDKCIKTAVSLFNVGICVVF